MQLALLVEVRQAVEEADKRLLNDILACRPIAQPALDEGKETALIARDQMFPRAGVALANLFPEAKSVALWLKHSWYVAVAYVIGFFVLLLVHGWHPNEPHKPPLAAPASQGMPVK